jgi:hypothetical protein
MSILYWSYFFADDLRNLNIGANLPDSRSMNVSFHLQANICSSFVPLKSVCRRKTEEHHALLPQIEVLKTLSFERKVASCSGKGFGAPEKVKKPRAEPEGPPPVPCSCESGKAYKVSLPHL